MYSPHTVTLILANETDDGMNYNSVVLNGVFLDLSKRSSLVDRGVTDLDSATLFIPFTISTDKTYLPPKQYLALADKSRNWTIFEGGENSGTECWFIKGEQAEDIYPFATAREKHDYCYRVTTVDFLDYGSEAMQHWEVGGR